MPKSAIVKQAQADVANGAATGNLGDPTNPIETTIALGPDPQMAQQHAEALRRLAIPVVAAKIKSGAITADDFATHDVAAQDIQRQSQGLPEMTDEEKADAANKSKGFWAQLGIDGKSAALVGAALAGAIAFKNSPDYNRAFEQQYTLSRQQKFADEQAQALAKATAAHHKETLDMENKKLAAENSRFNIAQQNEQNRAQGIADTSANTQTNENFRAILSDTGATLRNNSDNATKMADKKDNTQVHYTYDDAAQIVAARLGGTKDKNGIITSPGLPPDQLAQVVSMVTPKFLDFRAKHPKFSDADILNRLIQDAVTQNTPTGVTQNHWFKPDVQGYTIKPQ